MMKYNFSVGTSCSQPGFYLGFEFGGEDLENDSGRNTAAIGCNL